MATHYKGERISDLLKRIEELKLILDAKDETVEADDNDIAHAYMTLAWTKAKLTALRGEHDKD